MKATSPVLFHSSLCSRQQPSNLAKRNYLTESMAAINSASHFIMWHYLSDSVGKRKFHSKSN